MKHIKLLGILTILIIITEFVHTFGHGEFSGRHGSRNARSHSLQE